MSHQGNANQNHSEIPLHTYQIAIIKKQQIASFDEEVEKGNPSALFMKSLIGTITMENSMEAPKILKMEPC